MLNICQAQSFLPALAAFRQNVHTRKFADNRYDVNSAILGTSTSIFIKGWKLGKDTGAFYVGIGCKINSPWRIYAGYAVEISGEIYQNINMGIRFKF